VPSPSSSHPLSHPIPPSPSQKLRHSCHVRRPSSGPGPAHPPTAALPACPAHAPLQLSPAHPRAAAVRSGPALHVRKILGARPPPGLPRRRSGMASRVRAPPRSGSARPAARAALQPGSARPRVAVWLGHLGGHACGVPARHHPVRRRRMGMRGASSTRGRRGGGRPGVRSAKREAAVRQLYHTIDSASFHRAPCSLPEFLALARGSRQRDQDTQLFWKKSKHYCLLVHRPCTKHACALQPCSPKTPNREGADGRYAVMVTRRRLGEWREK
jgi:hypothetical protein